MKNIYQLKEAVLLCLFILSLNYGAFSQNAGSISGVVDDKAGKHIPFASVVLEKTNYAATTDENGFFQIKNVQAGNYNLVVSILGYEKISSKVSVKANAETKVSFKMKQEVSQLKSVEVTAASEKTSMQTMPETQGATIYADKKNEVIIPENTGADLAENNMREVFAKVPGITAATPDGTGVQAYVAARGLNPHRSQEFNVNQNGININSDLFGYPEQHYNPPMEGVERIELVRGSAALQYGPQFGGMLNYVIRQSDTTKVLSLESSQTVGSFGLFNSFNALGGKKGRWTYYGYFDYRTATGWRLNSGYHYYAGYASLHYQLSDNVDIGLECSSMDNTVQLAGGLTDAQFAANPRQSTRSRDYFNPIITIPALVLNAKIDDKTRLDVKTNVLTGQRNIVFMLATDTFNTNINSYNPRRVDRDFYIAYTGDARIIRTYKLFNEEQDLSAGIRYSNEQTIRRQFGVGTTGSDFDVSLTIPAWPVNLTFNTLNEAGYLENLFRISSRWTITPGIRYDIINSTMSGDLSKYNLYTQNYDADRTFLMKGIGSEFKLTKDIGLYANYSDAYHPVLYNNLFPSASNVQIDPNLQDSKGYNEDIGIRGKVSNLFDFDISYFNLYYGNRIGNITLPNGVIYTTNIGNALTQGVESYIGFHVLNLISNEHVYDVTVFSSYAENDARYQTGMVSIGKTNMDLAGNKVEDAPAYINNAGISFSNKQFMFSFMYSMVGKAFSDASNTVFSANGQTGIIPEYHVMDASIAYHFLEKYSLKAGVNNLEDNMYFTRRVTTYQGPGILPSDGRSFFISLGAKF